MQTTIPLYGFGGGCGGTGGVLTITAPAAVAAMENVGDGQETSGPEETAACQEGAESV